MDSRRSRNSLDAMTLEKAFKAMGARAKVREFRTRKLVTNLSTGKQRVNLIPENRANEKIRINILADNQGEYFDIQTAKEVEPEVLDVRKDLRHMVLMVRDGKAKSKYLCGHDDRHWFVAAVPGTSATTVSTAMESLKPREVSEKYIRQGEWFFISRPYDVPSTAVILKNEPIRRGRSKPHYCEELYRTGGVQVYVHNRYAPNGVGLEEYNRIIAQDNEHRAGWRVMTRDATVYARGAVRHPDHRTAYLDGWHQVLMNLKSRAPHADDYPLSGARKAMHEVAVPQPGYFQKL